MGNVMPWGAVPGSATQGRISASPEGAALMRLGPVRIHAGGDLTTMDIHDAKTQRSRLLEQAAGGCAVDE